MAYFHFLRFSVLTFNQLSLAFNKRTLNLEYYFVACYTIVQRFGVSKIFLNASEINILRLNLFDYKNAI